MKLISFMGFTLTFSLINFQAFAGKEDLKDSPPPFGRVYSQPLDQIDTVTEEVGLNIWANLPTEECEKTYKSYIKQKKEIIQKLEKKKYIKDPKALRSLQNDFNMLSNLINSYETHLKAEQLMKELQERSVYKFLHDIK